MDGRQDWPNGFATNPSNAAVTVFQSDSTRNTAVVELTNPRLDGNKLSYNVKVWRYLVDAASERCGVH